MIDIRDIISGVMYDKYGSKAVVLGALSNSYSPTQSILIYFYDQRMFTVRIDIFDGTIRVIDKTGEFTDFSTNSSDVFDRVYAFVDFCMRA